ncbi:hypothetical protein OF846_002081 [Rhodotorula toruloides]|nr:hypothetical protein OF846_002081 [Rhodotorula toruloides]
MATTGVSAITHRERARSRSRSPRRRSPSPRRRSPSPRRSSHRDRSRSPRERSRSRSPRRMDTDRERDRDRSDRDREHRGGAGAGGADRRAPFDPHRKAMAREIAASEAAKRSRKECRVYVGNLAFGVKWNDLKDFMREGEATVSLGRCGLVRSGGWRWGNAARRRQVCGGWSA